MQRNVEETKVIQKTYNKWRNDPDLPCFSLGRKQFPLIDQIFERLMRNPHQVEEEEKTEASIFMPAYEEKSFH